MKSKSLLLALLLFLSHLCLAQPSAADAPLTYAERQQVAIRINGLAGQIHSAADASVIVSELATMFAKELPSAWASADIRDRIAQAEYEAVSDPAKLIPELRVSEIWNQYVREIGASGEAIVSAAEIHNMRDGNYTLAQMMWARGFQTIWTMPNVVALGPDGKVADGCRPLEALRVLHDLDSLFQNLRIARDRLQKGVVASELKKSAATPNPPARTNSQLVAKSNPNPTAAAERRYAQEHSSATYYLLLKRLFDDLFPPPNE
jgi:hypothetical protein